MRRRLAGAEIGVWLYELSANLAREETPISKQEIGGIIIEIQKTALGILIDLGEGYTFTCVIAPS
jgi:hypothetical protein